ncbi:MAG: hypothetical protein H6Q56_1767 [Deltaproteobacteria bacterium]|nr:hypothetical protein [Deltaproteobacteria bacterium]
MTTALSMPPAVRGSGRTMVRAFAAETGTVCANPEAGKSGPNQVDIYLAAGENPKPLPAVSQACSTSSGTLALKLREDDMAKIMVCLIALLLPVTASAAAKELTCTGTTYYYVKGINQQPKLIQDDTLLLKLDTGNRTMILRLYDAVASLNYHASDTELISEMHLYNPRILNNKILYEVVHLNPESGDMIKYLVSDEPRIYPAFAGRCKTKNILF